MDAPLVRMDTPGLIKQFKSEATWENSDRYTITVYKTNGMHIVLIALHEDSAMQKHTAQGNISLQVLEGEILFSTDNQSEVIRKGQIIALH